MAQVWKNPNVAKPPAPAAAPVAAPPANPAQRAVSLVGSFGEIEFTVRVLRFVGWAWMVCATLSLLAALVALTPMVSEPKTGLVAIPLSVWLLSLGVGCAGIGGITMGAGHGLAILNAMWTKNSTP